MAENNQNQKSQSGKLNKKEQQKKIDDNNSYYNYFSGKMKNLWDFVNHRSFWVTMGLVGGLYTFKKVFIDRFVPFE